MKLSREKFSPFFPLFLVFLWVSAAQAVDLRTVSHVSDGDTIVLDNREKVRLIGVDTPEMHDEARNGRDAARNGLKRQIVHRFAAEAKSFLRDLIEGKQVRLEYDWERKDKYGRTLAYVFLDSGLLKGTDLKGLSGYEVVTLEERQYVFVNATMVSAGYGFAYTRFPFKYLDAFRDHEKQAKSARLGLWGS